MPSVVARPRCRTLEEWRRHIGCCCERAEVDEKNVLSFEETDLTQLMFFAENFIVKKIPLFVVPCQTGASALRLTQNKCRNCFCILVGPIDHVGAYNYNVVRIFATISSVALRKKSKQVYHLPIHNSSIFSYRLGMYSFKSSNCIHHR